MHESHQPINPKILPTDLRCGQRLLNLTNVRLSEAIISLSRHSNYRMTKRFLRGTLVWPSWFYRRTEATWVEPEYLMKCTLRVAHRLHAERGVEPDINFYSVKFHLHETMRYILRLAGYRPSKGGSAKTHYNVSPRVSKRPGMRERDRLRANAHTPKPKAREPSPEPVYVPPQRRVPVIGETCTTCGHEYMEILTRYQIIGPNTDRSRLSPYAQAWMDLSTGRFRPKDLAIKYRGVMDSGRPVIDPHRLQVCAQMWRRSHPILCACNEVYRAKLEINLPKKVDPDLPPYSLE
jgi:hypothetical protein